MSLTRRKFLVYGAGAIGYCLQPEAFIAAHSKGIDKEKPSQKKLVVVQLNGGNDALNMVVPYTCGRYFDARPNIALKQSEVLPLTSTTALHPSMPELAKMFSRNQMAIVQGVGYPDASSSHFRSSEIWHTGRPDEISETGWLERYTRLAAASYGNRSLGDGKCSQVVCDGDLNMIADLICADSEAAVFTTSIDGFDTHAKQKKPHAELLRHLSKEISQFFERLCTHSQENEVMTLVFSEFGRRLQENDDLGTDHGSSGSCLIVGGSISGGVYGAPLPTKWNKQESHFEIDFREVYATILEKWLGADSRAVLGARFDQLSFV